MHQNEFAHLLSGKSNTALAHIRVYGERQCVKGFILWWCEHGGGHIRMLRKPYCRLRSKVLCRNTLGGLEDERGSVSRTDKTDEHGHQFVSFMHWLQRTRNDYTENRKYTPQQIKKQTTYTIEIKCEEIPEINTIPWRCMWGAEVKLHFGTIWRPVATFMHRGQNP